MIYQNMLQIEEKLRKKMVSYIIERGNPFDISVTVMRIIASGKKLDDELVTFKANCWS